MRFKMSIQSSADIMFIYFIFVVFLFTLVVCILVIYCYKRNKTNIKIYPLEVPKIEKVYALLQLENNDAEFIGLEYNKGNLRCFSVDATKTPTNFPINTLPR